MTREMETKQVLDRFLDTEPYWVIWQVAHAPGGGRRIRRISQDYRTQAAAVLDAERFRRFHDRARHVDIGARRRRVAGRMVVHEDQRGR